MKQKLSISVDEQTVALIDLHVAEGRFRNKSHLIEYAVGRLLKEENHD